MSTYVVLVKRNAKPGAVMAILCQLALDACVVEREREREREREIDRERGIERERARDRERER